MAPERLWVDGLAIRGERIAALGDVEDRIGKDTLVIELDGRLVLPGFHDDAVDLYAGALWLERIHPAAPGDVGSAVSYLHRFGITSILPADRSRLPKGLRLRLGDGATGSKARFASGWPPATPDPLVWLQRAVTGRDLKGRKVSKETLPIEDAIARYVASPLRVGRLADLVVVQDDLLRIPPDRIAESKVEMTLFGGAIVYASATFDPRGRATLE